ncbi:MAG TPA: hypothetical protein VGP47_08360 [Parachlamydiaceae bacterium]|nr:hypothetical protein [Parachlamydiaceae bacterium]
MTSPINNNNKSIESVYKNQLNTNAAEFKSATKLIQNNLMDSQAIFKKEVGNELSTLKAMANAVYYTINYFCPICPSRVGIHALTISVLKNMPKDVATSKAIENLKLTHESDSKLNDEYKKVVKKNFEAELVFEGKIKALEHSMGHDKIPDDWEKETDRMEELEYQKRNMKRGIDFNNKNIQVNENKFHRSESKLSTFEKEKETYTNKREVILEAFKEGKIGTYDENVKTPQFGLPIDVDMSKLLTEKLNQLTTEFMSKIKDPTTKKFFENLQVKDNLSIEQNGLIDRKNEIEAEILKKGKPQSLHPDSIKAHNDKLIPLNEELLEINNELDKINEKLDKLK